MDHKTILTTTVKEIEIKKSRFIGRVYHVENEEEVDVILNSVKKEHYKATHVCSAYVLATVPERQKASDDGEPSGTAGKPILEVIRKNELKNILVVVIRYFGGIKLGAGGLIRAYSGTASEVLSEAPVVLKQLSDLVAVEIAYPLYGGLINFLNSKNVTPVEESFGEKVTLSFYLPVAETENFIAMVRDAVNDAFEYVILEQKPVDIPQ